MAHAYRAVPAPDLAVTLYGEHTGPPLDRAGRRRGQQAGQRFDVVLPDRRIVKGAQLRLRPAGRSTRRAAPTSTASNYAPTTSTGPRRRHTPDRLRAGPPPGRLRPQAAARTSPWKGERPVRRSMSAHAENGLRDRSRDGSTEGDAIPSHHRDRTGFRAGQQEGQSEWSRGDHLVRRRVRHQLVPTPSAATWQASSATLTACLGERDVLAEGPQRIRLQVCVEAVGGQDVEPVQVSAQAEHRLLGLGRAKDGGERGSSCGTSFRPTGDRLGPAYSEGRSASSRSGMYVVTTALPRGQW
jgi:hypothetical protein